MDDNKHPDIWGKPIPKPNTKPIIKLVSIIKKKLKKYH